MADEPTVPSEGEVPPVPEGELLEEPMGEDVADALGDETLGPPGGTVEELLHEAEANRRRANASMSLVHKEHFALLFANCFFFAGSLAAWRAAPYGQNDTGGMMTHGLDTIRGAGIFALSLYAFWTLAIGLYTKRTVVWPLLLNMLFGMWVGLGGVIRGIGSEAWDKAYVELQKHEYTALDNMLAGLSTIAPGYWMLTGASMLVLFIIVKGIVGGAAKSKSAASAGGGEGRRRR